MRYGIRVYDFKCIRRPAKSAAMFRVFRNQKRRTTCLYQTLMFSGVLALGALGASGCSGPCQTLAEMVCNCEPSRREQDSCLIRLDQNLDRSVTAEEEALCEEQLETCTCDALAQDDFAACGLAR